MKKITILCALILSAGLTYAQNAPIDFESGGNGAAWTWTTFENDDNPALEIVANPSSAAPNTSSMVAKFTSRTAGNPWAGCESKRGTTDLGKFSWDATNRTVKIMVWKPVISDVGIKFISDSGWAEVEVKVANTKVNEWEELTFDFSGKINPPANQGMLSQIAIFPDFQARAGDNICYIDNITFGSAATVPTPTIAAPDPTYIQDSVISLFSNVYTDVPVNTWRTGWSNAALSDEQVAGNDVKKYSSLGFVGIETVGANVIDASKMTHFNLNMWSHNSTVFKIKLVDFGADGAFQGGDDTEHELTFTAPAKEEWITYHIPLSDFAGLTAKEHIAQLVLVSEPTGTSTVYIDNVFFSKGGLLPEPMVAAPDPTYNQDSVISLFSNVYTDVTVDAWRTPWSNATLTDIQIQGNDVKKYSAMDFVGIETVGANVVDASGMDHVNFNIWSPNSTKFKIKIVDFGADGAFQGGDDTEHELEFNTPKQDTWLTYHIPFSDFTGLTAREHLAQYVMVSEPTGSSIIYMDNFFFSKGSLTSAPTLASFSKLNIYPNPATASVNLEIASPSLVISDYSIANLNGQTIHTEQVNSNTLSKTINTSSYKAGIYFVRVNTNQGIYTHKIVIQ